jgi:crotonobetainyl-CoA:carnitine CoA-transferase CaiB-like acyl-CoA transferase
MTNLNSATAGDAPLTGVRVLEIAHYIAGPYAAMILGDLGAEVVKIEPPGGEAGRHSPPLDPNGDSLYYASYNRNKKHLALDLRDPQCSAALEMLIRSSDAVVTNFALGVPEKLGFGYERVRELNPRCVMAQITGCGTWSAYRDYVAFDGVAQAMSGVADMTGAPDGPPNISNVLIGDHVTAMQTAMGVMAGLALRERTQQGTYVEVSMLRALSGLLGYYVPQVAVRDEDPHRVGNRSETRFMNVFPTEDGNILLNPITPQMWFSLCEIIGRPEWGTEEMVADWRIITDERLRAEIEAAIVQWLAPLPTREAEIILQAKGIACAGVRTVRQLVHEDEGQNLRLFQPVELESGGEALVMGRMFDWALPEPAGSGRISGVGADSSVLQSLPDHRVSDGGTN